MKLRLGHAFAVLVVFVGGCTPDSQAVHPERRSGKGESCQVTNDCAKPFLCLGGRCLDEASGLKPSAKVCAIGECVDDVDCCPPRSKPEQEDCDKRKEDCDSLGDCSFYESLCPTCTRTCTDFVCSAQPPTEPECTTFRDCQGLSNHCISGLCVDCTADKHCGDGYICESNACVLGCRHDEQCGALQACSKGRCVSRDCETDRECVGVLNVREAVCWVGACVIPCKSDRECLTLGGYAGGAAGLASTPLSACVDGACKSLGCETNAECARLYTGDQQGLRLCMTPAQVDALRDAQL